MQVTSHSPQETQSLGSALGELLQSGDVVCLSGDLGAGKTTFAAGVGRGWGAESPLTSPTFVIVRQYKRAADHQLLHHLDAYRLQSAADADSIGWDDVLESSGAVLIEWAENLGAALPNVLLWVRLEPSQDSVRLISFTPQGERPRQLLLRLEERLAAGN